MAYEEENWLNRASTRTDMTTMITHLTKKTNDHSAIEILMNILHERTIKGSDPGSSSYIVGKNKAVCFQESPLLSIAENILYEQRYEELLRLQNINTNNLKVRYQGVGIAFNKMLVYSKGGRPVFYESTDIAKTILPPDEYWRIVNFNLNDSNNIIDWTHEREWRVKGDFEFELEQVTLIISNKNRYKKLLEMDKYGYLEQVRGIVCLEPILF